MKAATRAAVLVVLGVIAVVVAARLLTPEPERERVAPTPLPKGSSELLRMSIDTRVVGARRRVPPSFLGFSTEIPFAERIMGTPGGPPNAVADGLYDALRATGSGAPVLRVGGSSAEQTWWNPAGRPRPAGVRFDITPAYLRQLRAFRRRHASPLVLVLNLAARSPAPAVGYARAARRALGSNGVRAYELGNEPDAYAGLPYREGSGGQAALRPAGYSFADFLGEWGARARILRDRVGPLPLAGPSVCCAEPFLSRFGEFARKEAPRLALLSLHEYFGAACGGQKPGTPGYPTRRRLLGPDEMDRIIAEFRESVAVGRRLRRPVAVTETNSFACGGQPGVSDTFAAALWAPEYLMRSAAAGVRGLYFHTFGRAYSPFDFLPAPGGQWTGTARPLYYGMLLFARSTANRATILLDPVARQRVRLGSGAVAFPTLDRNGTLRVMVLSKDARRGGSVRIAVPRGAGRARLTRLLAPDLGAKAGVTLAGQAVPERSLSGRLEGRERRETVSRRRGAYRFAMPAASAALLELRVRP